MRRRKRSGGKYSGDRWQADSRCGPSVPASRSRNPRSISGAEPSSNARIREFPNQPRRPAVLISRKVKIFKPSEKPCLESPSGRSAPGISATTSRLIRRPIRPSQRFVAPNCSISRPPHGVAHYGGVAHYAVNPFDLVIFTCRARRICAAVALMIFGGPGGESARFFFG